MTKYQGNKMIDSDDDSIFSKKSPIVEVMNEELSVHSVELLKARLVVLRSEIKRTDQAILDKGLAAQSAEEFFK